MKHEMTERCPLNLAGGIIDPGKNDFSVLVGGEAKLNIFISSPSIHPFQELSYKSKESEAMGCFRSCLHFSVVFVMGNI